MGKVAKLRRSAAEPTHFMNVDLDLEGRAPDLDALAVELDRRFMVLHRDSRGGQGSAHYELRTQSSTPDQALRGLCRAVERLGPTARRAWRAVRIRDFNIGLQAGRLPHATEYAIPAQTLDRVVALGVRLVITVYAPFPRPRKRAATRG